MTNESPMTWEELLASPFKISTVTTHNSSYLTETRRMFNMSDEAFHKMMRVAHRQLTDDLEGHGISYDSLAKALLPQHGRKETVLLFDSEVASARSRGFYGHDVAEAWIPALPKVKSGVPVNSILRGDILEGPLDQIALALQESVIHHRPHRYVHPQLMYCVYINNLSPTQDRELRQTVEEHPAYIGYADCSGRNTLKQYLGMSLMNSGLRVGDQILDGVLHDGRSFDGAPNAAGLPYKENGFTPTAIREHLFLPFLSYRINSHLTGRNAEDAYAALTTLSPDAYLVESPAIWMTPNRYEYLHDAGKHLVSLQQAGLDHLDHPGLEAVVSKLVAQGHIYNLRLNEYGALLYTSMVEVDTGGGEYKTFTVGLKFNPEDKRVELTTFF
ncbi:hypothetical protein ACIGBH_39450 [Streptomyces sp. NPDC085929]|uniref:hypothetical protein n=1 Tax=Streptomyces sp. NPDC085929 TaxID=3365739 RepID=UPI0037CDEA31